MALCKGKTELRPEMRKEATDERPEAAGKRVFYPGHGKKKGCGVMLMIYVRGVILMIYVRFVCAFLVAAGKNPVRKQAAAILIVS